MPVRAGTRTSVALTLGGMVLASGACQAQSTSPSQPGGSVIAALGSNVDLCHRDAGGSVYTPITVRLPEVGAHVSHGHSFPGDLAPGASTEEFDIRCAVVALEPVTITFDNLLVNNHPVPFYAEGGFMVVTSLAPWEAFINYGSPPPFLRFLRPVSMSPVDGEVEITEELAGATFVFRSVDLYSSVTPIPYVIHGLRNDAPVFAMSATIPNTFGRFAVVSNPHPVQMINTLVIRLTNPGTECCGNPVGLDNIVLWR